MHNVSFQGYPRDDGAVGVRNHLLVLPTCVCSAQCAMDIAARAASAGAVSFYHQHGCAQLEFDRVQTLRTLAGTGANPNVAAVLVVGLGCENVTADEIVAAIAAQSSKPVTAITIQDEGGTERTIERGIELVHRLAAVSGIDRATRQSVGLDHVVLALECGGSDALSGLTANPVAGWVADRVVAAGGTVILSETTELIGAEHLLAARAPNPAVAAALMDTVARVEASIKATGVDLRGSQPAPGNIRGGLTTIEEKSLGCIHKGGTSPLQEVLAYGVRPRCKGLTFMDTPGHDVESMTGMIAGGAHAVLFTTGRGTPTGAPVAPVIKIATNDRLWSLMRPNLDFSAGGIAAGRQTVASAGELLLDLLLDVLSGQLTRSEQLGNREFGIYRIGPTV